MTELLKPLVDWYLGMLSEGGYWLIALLMAIESSFVPLPSELVIPPAVAMGHETGRFTFWGIVAAGTFGSWVGASIMYWGSRWLGRPLLLRYGHYVLLPPHKIEAAHRWAEEFGAFGVFFARLLPGIRHLIGIPCGMVQMNYRTYSIFTILGSGIWCSVLYYVGVAAANDPALMRGELHQFALWALSACIILGLLYWFLVHRFMVKKSAKGNS